MLHANGSIERHKARLVALGNRQEYDIDFEETFAPLAKMTTIRTIIDIAASQEWSFQQIDVKNAFLHRERKEVYMTPPPSLFTHSFSKVCHLK